VAFVTDPARSLGHRQPAAVNAAQQLVDDRVGACRLSDAARVMTFAVLRDLQPLDASPPS
jgi:hypothetical protein